MEFLKFTGGMLFIKSCNQSCNQAVIKLLLKSDNKKSEFLTPTTSNDYASAEKQKNKLENTDLYKPVSNKIGPKHE